MSSEGTIATRGGGFLVADPEPDQVFTPEQFTEEQLMIGRTAETFADKEVRPRLKELEAGDHRLMVELLRKAAGLGLLGAGVPQAYGGLGLDWVTIALIKEKIARGASFAVSFGGHVDIGTLPIVLFGNEEQKKRYLPALALGEKLAAYALTEPGAGSDALGIQTLARRTADGRGFLLNGQKQFISNAGFADLFVLFAKVDGDKMTAFLVESGTEGLSVGPELKKMGLHASSTCSVYLSDVFVPAENVLGEIGRGHVVAFNILNFGRFNLAGGCVGSCKAILEACARYASQRVQFGRPIAEFPAIQQKLAQMSARTYAVESAVYRTAGLFDSRIQMLASQGEVSAGDVARAIGEYAAESSINKVFASETLDFVADEGVQIHGGYGYLQEFDVERAYRDARINRLFEGTNEINRMVVLDILMRRANRGELPLFDAVQRVQKELASHRPAGPGEAASRTSVDASLADEVAHLADLKRVALMLAGLGAQKYLTRIEEEQEFLLAVADLALLVFTWESALLRARQVSARLGPEEASRAVDMALLFGNWASDQAESTARRALAGMEQGDTLQVQLALLRRLLGRTPANEVILGRRVARLVLESGGYPVVGVPSKTGQ